MQSPAYVIANFILGGEGAGCRLKSSVALDAKIFFVDLDYESDNFNCCSLQIEPSGFFSRSNFPKYFLFFDSGITFGGSLLIISTP